MAVVCGPSFRWVCLWAGLFFIRAPFWLRVLSRQAPIWRRAARHLAPSPHVSILVERMSPIPAFGLAFRCWIGLRVSWLFYASSQRAAQNRGHHLEEQWISRRPEGGSGFAGLPSVCTGSFPRLIAR